MHHLLIFVLLFGRSISTEVCPPFISCESSETQDSCPKGTYYRQNIRLHGCCPGCDVLKDEHQPCEVPEECRPGLTCTNQKQCEEDPTQACEFYKRNNYIWKKTKYWNPVCLPDGSFAPKQCKGEKMAGKCFCMSADGRRIFGEEAWSAAETMSCSCSRLADVLSRKGLEVNLHCDHLGNFEPLQCEQKVCWCANPTTGVPYTVMVPIDMITSLSCYRRNAVGSQYYRRCESANHIQELTKSLLSNHGTTGITWGSFHCNFDGSYHRVQTLGAKKRCVYINNSPLTEAIKSDNANCNCAYDKYLAELNREEFLVDCDPNGNYRTRQVSNGKNYCIDEDGFHFSDDWEDCP